MYSIFIVGGVAQLIDEIPTQLQGHNIAFPKPKNGLLSSSVVFIVFFPHTYIKTGDVYNNVQGIHLSKALKRPAPRMPLTVQKDKRTPTDLRGQAAASFGMASI